MSSKGDRSKKRILQEARKLFATKGFSAVTMQDICHATALSRGGLYRHYGSTEEIFAAIIEQEQTEALHALDRAKKAGISPQKILQSFLESRVEQLLDPTCSIDNATSEYAAVSAQGRAVLEKRARASVEIITQMLELGKMQGSFSCPSCPNAALHILWLLEGMGKHSALLPLSKEEAYAQLQLIWSLLNNR